jgi:murein DD-endopeptidase MepM/ murein hydrolase activator NlpD
LTVNPIRWCVAVSAAALSVVLAAPAAGDPADDKARVDRELLRASASLEAATDRARQAAAEHAAALAALPAAEAALAEAQGRVVAAAAAVRRTERGVAAARGEQVSADQRYAAAADQVDRARAGVERFTSATYKGGSLLLVSALLDAGSPSEFTLRLGYLDQVATDQRRALHRLTDARSAAREQRSSAAEARRRAEAAAAASASALATSREAAAVAQRAAGEVQALVRQREQAVATANAERAAVLARYNDLQAESARIAAQLRAAAARRASGGAAPVAPRPGAYFLMPAHGWKTSDFGMRFHPLFRVWLMHTGMDIGAAAGQPIYAATDGVVVQAGWRGGYGNYTCVHHGAYQAKGLATCYGHQLQILVATGQRVRRGQIIGRVGSTGTATGAHLHFEVRLDGTPVDPQPWLPACLCQT